MTTHITVEYTRDVYVTREGDPEDCWDRDSTAADLYVEGIRVVSNANYRELTVSFDVEPGKSYWLVWADYDTGDSFGRDGNQIEFVDLFTDMDTAIAAAKSVEKTKGKWTRQDGVRASMCVPWEGYFENLNGINVQCVKIIK